MTGDNVINHCLKCKVIFDHLDQVTNFQYIIVSAEDSKTFFFFFFTDLSFKGNNSLNILYYDLTTPTHFN